MNGGDLKFGDCAGMDLDFIDHAAAHADVAAACGEAQAVADVVISGEVVTDDGGFGGLAVDENFKSGGFA